MVSGCESEVQDSDWGATTDGSRKAVEEATELRPGVADPGVGSGEAGRDWQAQRP